MRDLGRAPDPRDMSREREAQAQHQNLLQRQLRPHDGYERGPQDRRY
jgi:hypothetical protein